jgi:uncharacterized protein involved in type VI secretion and phage assembly
MMPSASGDTESDWMRVAFPGAGGGGSADTHHGWSLLPDVNDEVLVIFEQGDARRGYVLGGLLNGKDVPFYDNSKVVAGDGKVVQHAFRTTNGTHLLFDATSGKEHVELIGKNKKGFHFKFDDSDGAILTTTSGEKLTITNKGEIIVHAENSNIKIDAGSGNLTVTAQDITLDAKGKVTVKAGQDASLEAGANAKVKGNASAELSGAMAKVEGSGQTTIKGGMVMIN